MEFEQHAGGHAAPRLVIGAFERGGVWAGYEMDGGGDRHAVQPQDVNRDRRRRRAGERGFGEGAGPGRGGKGGAAPALPAGRLEPQKLLQPARGLVADKGPHLDAALLAQTLLAPSQLAELLSAHALAQIGFARRPGAKSRALMRLDEAYGKSPRGGPGPQSRSGRALQPQVIDQEDVARKPVFQGCDESRADGLDVVTSQERRPVAHERMRERLHRGERRQREFRRDPIG